MFICAICFLYDKNKYSLWFLFFIFLTLYYYYYNTISLLNLYLVKNKINIYLQYRI